MRFLFILMLCAGAALAGQAGAVSLGDTVTCGGTFPYYCKNNPVSAAVGTGAEFVVSYNGSANDRFTVDFSDNQLTLTSLANFVAGSAQNRVLTFGDLTHPITGITSFAVTVPPNKGTNITQSYFSVANGAIRFALDGMSASKGVTITIGLASAPPIALVPEPATWAMMVGGFGLVGATMRRRRRSGAPC